MNRTERRKLLPQNQEKAFQTSLNELHEIALVFNKKYNLLPTGEYTLETEFAYERMIRRVEQMIEVPHNFFFDDTPEHALKYI